MPEKTLASFSGTSKDLLTAKESSISDFKFLSVTQPVLPPGVTGCASLREFQTLDYPGVDVKLFKTHCHLVARELGGSVRSLPAENSPPIARSYLEATLQLPERELRVMLNGLYPILAFAQTELELGRGTYVSDTDAAQAFRAFDVYDVLEPAVLNLSLTPAILSRLGKAELKEAGHWKSSCVGEVIFNWWD